MPVSSPRLEARRKGRSEGGSADFQIYNKVNNGAGTAGCYFVLIDKPREINVELRIHIANWVPQRLNNN